MDQSPGLPLKRSSVVVVVLLTLVTAGIYCGVWYLRRRKGLNALGSSTKLPVVLPLALVAVTVAFLATPSDAGLWWILRLGLTLITLFMAFRVRWMLVEHYRTRITAALPMSASIQAQNEPSSILTFFLQIWYLQYKINELVEMDTEWAPDAVVGAGAP